MYVLIAGGGKVGFYLAQELLQSNHEVLILEQDANRVAAIIEELGENAMHGDGCEATTLDAAGVARADLVAAVTGDDEDNLVVCEIARQRGVPRTIARINNPTNELLFKRRGIETTISATQAVLAQIEGEPRWTIEGQMMNVMAGGAGNLIVVDPDVDVRDRGDVEWALWTRTARADKYLVLGEAQSWDMERCAKPGRGSLRLAIDATSDLEDRDKLRRATLRGGSSIRLADYLAG